MQKATIRGTEQPIVKVFSSDYCFIIPSYQRPYSWTTEEASQLLDDLVYFAFQEDDFDSLKPYFLGSVVLIKEEDNPTAKVVDGQQRLTTITILLSVMRELLPGLSEQITEIIYEKGNIVKGTKDRFRLSLRERDQDFFNEYVQKEGGLSNMPIGEPLADSQNNIRKNALHLKDRLQREYTMEQCKRLTEYLVQKCFLVIVSSSDEESAFRIFSVLNSRGMQLSHSDILKAEVIGAISKDSQHDYTDKWEKIEEDLGIDSFRDLFTHIRMIARKAKARDTVLREIRDSLEPSKNPEGFIDNTLVPYANAFYEIVNISYEATSKSEEINRYLRWLNTIDNYDWIPPAVQFLSKYGKSDTEKILDFLVKLERLAFGLWVMHKNINDRIERYSGLLNDIEENIEIDHEECHINLSNDERSNILNILAKDVYGERYTKYLLLRIDTNMSQGEAYYQYPIITVEHVLPQNPDSTSEWVSTFTDSEREELTHCLGNLVLLSRRKNSAAQNYDFEKKKKSYFQVNGTSPFAITTDVLNIDTWTPDVIRKRTDKLLDLCKNIWNI